MGQLQQISPHEKIDPHVEYYLPSHLRKHSPATSQLGAMEEINQQYGEIPLISISHKGS